MMVRTKEQSAAAMTPAHNGFSLIPNEKLLLLYTAMVKCRTIAERMRGLLEQSALTGRDEFSLGHEAAQVGVTIDLLPEDTVAPSRHEFMAGFIKGEPLDNVFGRLSAHAADADLTTQINIAMDSALANKKKKNGKIAVAFLGDGTAPLGYWHQALKVAGAHRLPILFVYQNSLSAQTQSLNARIDVKEITRKAETCSLPSITVDGNDVVAVYRVATEAATQARKGNGPTLIDCQSQRTNGCSEIDPANVRDPILNMQIYLTRKGLFSEELKLEAASSFSKRLDAAIALSPRSATLSQHPAWVTE